MGMRSQQQSFTATSNRALSAVQITGVKRCSLHARRLPTINKRCREKSWEKVKNLARLATKTRSNASD
ncbi:MAG: hypothetical protein ACI8VC_001931 [Candidatus Endobugula sp.]|jgi:hypothetical protein